MRLRFAKACVVLAAWWPAVAAACSGPGAMAKIERAERLGWLLFAVTAVLAVSAGGVLRRWRVGWRRLWWVALPVAVHPGWWLSARGGDCGTTRLIGSVAVTALAAVAWAVVVIAVGLRRRA